MGNGSAKPSTSEPNYYDDDEWQPTNRTDGGRQSRHNSAGERRDNNPSSPRASPRRSFSARKEPPPPQSPAVPPLSRESTTSLGQRIARHAKQQDAFDGPDEVTDGYHDDQKFHQRPTKGAERYREDDVAPEEMEPEEEWQPPPPPQQYGDQNRRQREEVFRQDPVATQRRKGVSFNDDLTESFEDPRVRLPPLVNNGQPPKGKRFTADQLQAPPPVARNFRSIEDREYRTVPEADVRDKLMNGRPRARFAEPQVPRKSQWAMDDDNISNYSSSTTSLVSRRPSRIPQRTTAPRRTSVLPPLDSNDTLSSNGLQYSARPIRRQIPSMDTIPVEANFYHLYHHGIQKKLKRTQQRQW